MAGANFSKHRIWSIGGGRFLYLGEPGDRWHGWYLEFVCGRPGHFLPVSRADSEFVFRAQRAKQNGALTEATLAPGTKDIRGLEPN